MRTTVDAESVKAIANAVMLSDFTGLNENPYLFICKSAKSVPKRFTNAQ